MSFEPCQHLKDLLSCGVSPLDLSDDFGSIHACSLVGHHLSMVCTNSVE